MKKSIEDLLEKLDTKSSFVEAGNEGHDVSGHDDPRVAVDKNLCDEEPLLNAIDVQVDPQEEPAGGGLDTKAQLYGEPGECFQGST